MAVVFRHRALHSENATGRFSVISSRFFTEAGFVFLFFPLFLFRSFLSLLLPFRPSFPSVLLAEMSLRG